MKLVLVRHPPPAIAGGVCYGRLDVGLADPALLPRMAQALAAHRPAHVWSSPAQRCRLPAEAVAAASGASLRLDDRLRELDFGAWEGQPWDAVPRAALDRWAADPLGFAAPGGESGASLVARVDAVWMELRAAAEDALVIAHGGPLRVLLARAHGLAPDLLAPAPPFGSVTVVLPARPAPRIPPARRLPPAHRR